ncbi:MAG TPA: SDR family NAD(P)-dependent oxidoreductase, partial [Flavobacterium sp.]|nr:SDR family NAD(P)-dependent oxidoreductase [Flavobacterium sp.]
MKQISILGCGWLGFPLAKSLLQNGFSVNGSTTTLEKMAILENAGINAFQIALSEEEIVGEMFNFLSKSEVLIIDIPPKLRGNSNENFIQKIKNLIP